MLIRLSAIGDVVRVLPALHVVRAFYPTAQIDFAVESKSADVVTGHPALDQILIFERNKDKLATLKRFIQFCQTIKKNRYDIVLDFHGILKTGFMLRASHARERYGFSFPRSQELSYLFTNKKVRLLSERMNRIEENLELVKALGASVHNLEVVIDVDDEVRNEVDRYLEESFHGGKEFVVVHAPVDRPEKQWPLEYYSQLCDLLLADGRFEVLLTWGPGQRAVVEKVAAGCKRNPEIAPETPDLKHFAWLVQHAALFFGGDTGPMHIASAMNAPVVTVFGGTDPAKHAPLRKPSRVLYAGPNNPPKRIRLEDAQKYLRAIDAETAYDACIELLHS